jgi:hypothetical protein
MSNTYGEADLFYYMPGIIVTIVTGEKIAIL